MTGDEFLDKLKFMFKENPKLKKARVQIEYRGTGGCDTCGYGSEETEDVSEHKIYDLDTKLVISIA